MESVFNCMQETTYEILSHGRERISTYVHMQHKALPVDEWLYCDYHYEMNLLYVSSTKSKSYCLLCKRKQHPACTNTETITKCF